LEQYFHIKVSSASDSKLRRKEEENKLGGNDFHCFSSSSWVAKFRREICLEELYRRLHQPSEETFVVQEKKDFLEVSAK
jgi:hypothetical protein